MIKIDAAMIYRTATGMAYQTNYTDGNKVRAVMGIDGTIQKEYSDGKEWKLSGKPYIVVKNRKRQAEKLVEQVKNFINSEN